MPARPRSETAGAAPAGSRLEHYGVDAVPPELRTTTWRGLLPIFFAFNASPLMFVIGALAASAGGLSVWWSAIALFLGTTAGNVALVLAGRVGVEHGLAGPVAMRATFGLLGSRGFTSPYRLAATCYWFAAQSLAAALGVRAIVETLTGETLPLVPVSVGAAALAVLLAVVGFDAMRWVGRVVLPLAVLGMVLIVVAFVVADDARFHPGTVLAADTHGFAWVGFAAFLTVTWGGQVSAIPSAADFCRYARSTRDVAIGLGVGSGVASFIAGWFGAYAMISAGETTPFAAAAAASGTKVLLVILLLALVAQVIAVNVTNAYTGGLSLVNALPALGRVRSTIVAGVIAVVLSALPELVEEAQSWFTHLGNVAAPLTGVILADYLGLKQGRLDVPGLFDPHGRYRYLGGINPAAILAVAGGVAVFYVMPDAWLKVAFGTIAGAALYVLLAELEGRTRPDLRPGLTAG